MEPNNVLFEAGNLVNDAYLSAERLNLLLMEQGEELFDQSIPDGNGADAKRAKMRILFNYRRAEIRHQIMFDYCNRIQKRIDELDKLLNGHTEKDALGGNDEDVKTA